MKKHPCPVCSSSDRHYLFHSLGNPIVQCAGCGLVQRDFSRKTKRGTLVLTQDKFDMFYHASPPEDDETEADFAQRCLNHINSRGITAGRALISSPVLTPKLENALKLAGFHCKFTPDIRREALGAQNYDVIVLPYSLERYDNPASVLDAAHLKLNDNGLLVVSTQRSDSKWARVLGQQWSGWRPEMLFYFNSKTLQLLLEQRGFRQLVAAKDKRLYSLEHITARARIYPRSWVTAWAAAGCLLPKVMRQNLKARICSSGMIVSARKSLSSTGSMLSIIMPVYNERASFAETLEKVIAKELDGIETREIVIVESNSKDGTRELVQTYENRPGIKIVYEDRPRGKGHAVRVGFEHAVGDIILIQDADSEYDVDDYDSLLAPLLAYKELFVLGSRHNGSWKMRKFSDQPQLAAFMNLGQILFTTLLNVLYQQNMTDPFTMYKVLRRECLYGIHFECNRFDFDHELVIKLVLKGYKAFETPVNYTSRSYSEGKKVTFVQDPLLWIRANFKFRVVSPYTSEYQKMVAAAAGKVGLLSTAGGAAPKRRQPTSEVSVSARSAEPADSKPAGK